MCLVLMQGVTNIFGTVEKHGAEGICGNSLYSAQLFCKLKIVLKTNLNKQTNLQFTSYFKMQFNWVKINILKIKYRKKTSKYEGKKNLVGVGLQKLDSKGKIQRKHVINVHAGRFYMYLKQFAKRIKALCQQMNINVLKLQLIKCLLLNRRHKTRDCFSPIKLEGTEDDVVQVREKEHPPATLVG